MAVDWVEINLLLFQTAPTSEKSKILPSSSLLLERLDDDEDDDKDDRDDEVLFVWELVD
jgi:hypothetical protein